MNVGDTAIFVDIHAIEAEANNQRPDSAEEVEIQSTMSRRANAN